MAQPAPGWFPDPFDPAQLRWWDGQQWTTHLHPAERGPARAASAPRPPAPGAPRRRTRVATLALGTAAALLLGGATATGAGLLALVPAGGAGDSHGGVVVAPSATATSAPEPEPSSPGTAGLAPVVSVTDGDTLRVRVGGVVEKVRVIGIDTPELRTGECYADRAASRMRALVQGREVRLTRDPTQADRDRHGRLLRHAALRDGRQVAELLIAEGLGREFTYDEPYAGQASYRAAERTAREARRGIWGGGCRAPAGDAPPASG